MLVPGAPPLPTTTTSLCSAQRVCVQKRTVRHLCRRTPSAAAFPGSVSHRSDRPASLAPHAQQTGPGAGAHCPSSSPYPRPSPPPPPPRASPRVPHAQVPTGCREWATTRMARLCQLQAASLDGHAAQKGQNKKRAAKGNPLDTPLLLQPGSELAIGSQMSGTAGTRKGASGRNTPGSGSGRDGTPCPPRARARVGQDPSAAPAQHPSLLVCSARSALDGARREARRPGPPPPRVLLHQTVG